jgi:hypothetical protein
MPRGEESSSAVKAYQLLPRDKFWTREYGIVEVVRTHEDSARGFVTAIVRDREGTEHPIAITLGDDVEVL